MLQILSLLGYSGLYFLFKSSAAAQPLFNTALFAVGLVLGMILVWADARWLHQYYQEKKGELVEGGLPEQQLITRSLLFALALLPLSIYLITSTGSPTGVGMLLGILVSLTAEILLLRKDRQKLSERFLSQLSRPATAQDIDWYIRLFTVFTVIISILIVF